jgi:hypothetical protein
MKPEVRRYIDSFPWTPQPGPQTAAYFHPADVLLYGGAAGGGKTALACGLAITRHQRTLFIRRESTQLGGVLDEVATIIDPTRKGYSGGVKEWRIPPWDGATRKIIFGSCPNLGDETKYQGNPRDLLVIDEAANMIEGPVRFLMGWSRTTDPNQRTRVLMCSNPPTSSDGLWLIQMFGPWLDPMHPNPAMPGEIRWFTTIAGLDVELASGEPYYHNGELIIPESRSFIPARVSDNKFLDAKYVSKLQAMPEPLRSQMLYGDFTAGQEDAEWQVIPSEWVELAFQRWEERPFDPRRITSTGVDPSRGGKDDTVIAMREDWYYHPLKTHPGHQMKSGADVCGKVIELVGDAWCPVHVDVIGIGASTVDHLQAYIDTRTVPVNAAASAGDATDWSGNFKFINERARLWWQFRDLLNPANGRKVALQRNTRLKSELCAPRYWSQANGIKVEAKEDIVKRLGRSTDYADAVIMAAERTPITTSDGNFHPPSRAKRST